MENFLKLIPSLFEINLNTDKDGSVIFKKLADIISFDEGFIYFLNPDSLQLKYSFKEHRNYKINEVFPITGSIKQKLFSKEGAILTSYQN